MKIDFRVYLITDRKRCRGEDLLRTVEQALEGGVRAVQLREKDLPGGELFRLAERMRERTEKYGAKLLINDRADVARAVGADGVHLGVHSIPPGEARRLLGPRAIIGCSTHNAPELRQAEEGGADFVTFGAVYATTSKAPLGRPAGISALAEACRTVRVPVFALGGIGRGNLEEISRAGGFGVALISGILADEDPREAAAAITGFFAGSPRPSNSEREGAL